LLYIFPVLRHYLSLKGVEGLAKERISTPTAPGALAAYSQAIKSNGFIFVAGQGPFDPASGEVVGTTIQEQTAQCLRNIEAILLAGGSSLEKAVSATFILVDESEFPGMNEEWGKWFGDVPPVRQGSKFLFPEISPKFKDMKISIWLISEA
jgi:2-iminobutanoate/2-iminopropanoate deaminase